MISVQLLKYQRAYVSIRILYVFSFILAHANMRHFAVKPERSGCSGEKMKGRPLVCC